MNFRKAFFPTEEESNRQKELLMELEHDNFNFWKSKGFTEDEIKRIIEVEDEEVRQLHSYQYYVSKRQLLESNIISVEQIKEELS